MLEMRRPPPSFGPPAGFVPPPAMRRFADRQSTFRIVQDSLLYAFIVSVCQAAANLRRARERERLALEVEASLAQARLQALRIQLDPHFLFNTLNSIATLIHTQPQAADEMIGSLGGFLRLSLDTTDEHEVPLRRELDFLRAYLDIEQVRFGDRLSFTSDLPPDTLTTFVPTFLLQPLAENSIRHGIDPQRSAGRIILTSHCDGDTLRLTLEDNGAGLPATIAEPTGIGLATTRARLRELHGDRQSLALRTREAGGCVVEIALPLHTEPIRIL